MCLYRQYFFDQGNQEDYFLAKDYLHQATGGERSKEAYEALAELLLKHDANFSLSGYTNVYDRSGIYRSKKDRLRSYKRYRGFGKEAYIYVPNRLLSLDILVQRASNKFSDFKYDKKWLAQRYYESVKQLLASPQCNNPSEYIDDAYDLLERAYRLDMTNRRIRDLRENFRCLR